MPSDCSNPQFTYYQHLLIRADPVKRKTRTSFNHKLTFTTKKTTSRRWLYSILLFPAFAGALAYGIWREERRPILPDASPASIGTAHQGAARAPVAPPIKKVEIDYVIKPNDTLGLIFTQLKIDVTELSAILGSPVARDRFKPLKPGDKLTLALENGILRGIERRLSETEVLSIRRSTGGFTAHVVSTPIEIKTVQIRGTLGSSVFAPGRTAGLSPELVQQLANDIFGWDIDFALEVRPGDRFNVVYEQKYRGAEYLGDGRVLAAEFINDGETYRAVRYTSSDGKVDGYFTPDGRRLHRPFVRAPLDTTRVVANDASHDRERIISTMTAHNGIDYAAPTGTVVKAAGDGVVRFAGMNGEYGNVVILEHGAKTSTLYAHLSAFARGLQGNQRVKQGEVIGYVGNSGAATAPHLHYEYRINGTHADPATADIAESDAIPADYLDDFRSKSAALVANLNRPGEAVVTAPREKNDS